MTSTTNKSIFDFFKKAPPPTEAAAKGAEEPPKLHMASTTKNAVPLPPPVLKSRTGLSKSSISKAPEPSASTTSSLSSPPYTISNEREDHSIGRETTPLATAASNESSGRIINSTDDEDSDSSLEDLAVILGARRTENIRPASSMIRPPRTPTTSRVKTNFNFHTSPLTMQSKSQFDMKSLMSHALKDDAAEASSKRVKAMMAPKNEKDHSYSASGSNDNKAKLDALLDSVAGEHEGGVAKVHRALKRTEATVAEKRWYFFETEYKTPKETTNSFPKAAGLKGWENEFKDPQMRHQSFVTGFVEDMLSLGKQLPDELFLWILNEAFLETHDPLRNSYLNLLRECPEQSERLLVPERIRKLFQKLGATQNASILAESIRPVLRLSDVYLNHDWSRVCSALNFLGKIGSILKQDSRIYLMCMILRMSVDRAILENVEILVQVHRAMYYMCRYAPDEEWESSCSQICKALITTVSEASFRLQMVDSIPSGSAKTHDLRRRLAMSFFFNDASYSTTHPHTTMDIQKFVTRLEDPCFDANPQTDYFELTALVLLLDVAVDDGRSSKVNLDDALVEREFNRDVDELVASIKEIMKSIGNPGAAFISRIEAKEALELISQRIADTVRTKKVVKKSWFDRNRVKHEDTLGSEKQGMSKFLTKMNQIKKGVDS